MAALIIPRSDVNADEVAGVLRRGLGSGYTVLAGKGMNWNPAGGPQSDEPDKIVVGTGSTRLFRAEVTMTRQAGQTTLRVVPGGISLLLRLANELWIARKARHLLRDAPGL